MKKAPALSRHSPARIEYFHQTVPAILAAHGERKEREKRRVFVAGLRSRRDPATSLSRRLRLALDFTWTRPLHSLDGWTVSHIAMAPPSTTPIRDITNRATPSSSRAPKRPSTYRQTSLADSLFFRSSSPIQPSTPSAPSCAVFGSDAPVAGPSSDATTPERGVQDADGDAQMDLYDEEDAEEDDKERQARKRRRVASSSPSPRDEMDDWSLAGRAQLVGAWGTGDAKGKAKMPASQVLPGEQFSAFEAMRRRELGFRAGRAQRTCTSRRRMMPNDALRHLCCSVIATVAPDDRVEQRNRRRAHTVRPRSATLCSALCSRLLTWCVTTYRFSCGCLYSRRTSCSRKTRKKQDCRRLGRGGPRQLPERRAGSVGGRCVFLLLCCLPRTQWSS